MSMPSGPEGRIVDANLVINHLCEEIARLNRELALARALVDSVSAAPHAALNRQTPPPSA